MKLPSYLALGLLALTTAMSPAAATRSSPQYTSLTVFGDSLTDAGNYLRSTNGQFPGSQDGYFDGRFTNGYDFTDLLSQKWFGTATLASQAGGANYALGGAHTYDAPGQIAQYQQDLSAKASNLDGNGLYVLEFGANDIFYADTLNAADRDVYLHSAAQSYADLVRQLSDLGARNILVPAFASVLSPTGGVAYGYLSNDIAALSLGASTSVLQYDMSGFFHTALNDPSKVGLPSLQNDTSCIADHAQPDCAGHFSFDGTHPTAIVQSALFDDMNQKLTLVASVPEPGTWAMMLIGFALVGLAMRRRKTRAVARIQSPAVYPGRI